MMVSISEQLESRLDEALEANPVPGVAAGLIVGDEEHIACRGITSIGHPLPVDRDTLFQIGSTVKTLTATALIRLVAENRARLDDPVRRYLPDFRVADETASATVTLRHLLTHTAGWQGDMFEDTGPGDDALARYVDLMGSLPQQAQPGHHFSYANTAYCVAGRVIEAIIGAPYETALRELLIEPLGLETSFFFADEAITERVAVGHLVRDGQTGVARPWALARAWNPAGGLACSMCDVLTWARFSLSDGSTSSGRRLLDADAMAAMQRPQAPAGGGRAAEVGLSWLIQTSRAVPLLTHGGSTVGQESGFVLAPDRRLAIAVLTNSERGSALHATLTRRLLDDFVGPTQRTDREPASPAEMGNYTGIFTGYLHDFEVRCSDMSPTLWMTPHFDGTRRIEQPEPVGPMDLQVFRGGRVRIASGALRGAGGEFVPSGDGGPRWLRLNGQLHTRAGVR